MNVENCSPLQCEKAMACIEGVKDPSILPAQWSALRSQLIDCPPCLHAFDLEARLRTTMMPVESALPSIDLRARITETLQRVDLSQLEITDF